MYLTRPDHPQRQSTRTTEVLGLPNNQSYPMNYGIWDRKAWKRPKQGQRDKKTATSEISNGNRCVCLFFPMSFERRRIGQHGRVDAGLRLPTPWICMGTERLILNEFHDEIDLDTSEWRTLVRMAGHSHIRQAVQSAV
jgi:hypothetical protein